ncbi:MAG: hypothetical protein Q4G33_05980 [bacterium]|nr:hypothetical protein [bacterium]
MNNTTHYEAARVKAELMLNSYDATGELEENLESITYNDVANGESDSVDITLFCGGTEFLDTKWIPKGTELEAKIIAEHWKELGARTEIDCGSHLVDEINFDAFPTEMTVSAVAIPVQGTKNTKTWENMNIQAIASDICSHLGCSLDFSGEDIVLEEKKQSQETDINFLYKLCTEYGKGMKVYRNKIVIYEREALDAADAASEFEIKDVAESKSISLVDTMDGQYTGVEAHYKIEGSDEDYIYNLGTGDKLITLDNAGKSLNEAQMKAKAALYDANVKEVTLKFTANANSEFYSGLNYVINGLGVYSGKYGADKVIHSLNRNGYSQKVELHAIEIKRDTAPYQEVNNRDCDTPEGRSIELSGVPLYMSSDAGNPVRYMTGTYSLYDGTEFSGRYRLCNNGDAGKTPINDYVIGYIDKQYI